jgi:plasmid stabilization system protein ParE
MPSVVIRPKALEDLAEIWAYIAEDSPRQADAFAAAIDFQELGERSVCPRFLSEYLALQPIPS